MTPTGWAVSDSREADAGDTDADGMEAGETSEETGEVTVRESLDSMEATGDDSVVLLRLAGRPVETRASLGVLPRRDATPPPRPRPRPRDGDGVVLVLSSLTMAPSSMLGKAPGDVEKVVLGKLVVKTELTGEAEDRDDAKFEKKLDVTLLVELESMMSVMDLVPRRLLAASTVAAAVN